MFSFLFGSMGSYIFLLGDELVDSYPISSWTEITLLVNTSASCVFLSFFDGLLLYWWSTLSTPVYQYLRFNSVSYPTWYEFDIFVNGFLFRREFTISASFQMVRDTVSIKFNGTVKIFLNTLFNGVPSAGIPSINHWYISPLAIKNTGIKYCWQCCIVADRL